MSGRWTNTGVARNPHSRSPTEQGAVADRPREGRFVVGQRPSPREPAAELWRSDGTGGNTKRESMARITLGRVGILSFSLLFARMSSLFGLLIGPGFVALEAYRRSSGPPPHAEGQTRLVLLVVFSLVAGFLGGFVGGFVWGLVWATVYNLVVRAWGGVTIDAKIHGMADEPGGSSD